MPKPVHAPAPFARNPRFVGLDMSLNATGFCLLGAKPTLGEHFMAGHDLLTTRTIKNPEKLTGPSRLLHIRRTLQVLLWDSKPDLVAIEGYAHGASFKAHALGEVGGMARMLLWEMALPFVEVQPTSLKLCIGEHGKIKKPALRKVICKKWGHDFKDNNQADAYGLALVAGFSFAPSPHAINAGEWSLVQSLRYCSRKGQPAPLLSRSI